MTLKKISGSEWMDGKDSVYTEKTPTIRQNAYKQALDAGKETLF